MPDKNAGSQINKTWRETNSAVDWDGTTATIHLDGDKPIVGVGINLSADAEVTFDAVIGGVNHEINKDDETPLSLTMTAANPIYRLFTEFAGVRTLLITADSSQTNATITTYQVS